MAAQNERSVITWHICAFFCPNMVKWRNGGIINLNVTSYYVIMSTKLYLHARTDE